MEIDELIYKLRMRVADYRRESRQYNKEVSIHTSAIEIVISLTEYGLKEARPINTDEMHWFRAGLYIDYVFGGSEWEDIYEDFKRVVEFAKRSDYFNKTT